MFPFSWAAECWLRQLTRYYRHTPTRADNSVIERTPHGRGNVLCYQHPVRARPPSGAEDRMRTRMRERGSVSGKDPQVQPLLKWVGGKRQLIKHIEADSPEHYGRLIEPFVGGGAVAFHTQHTPLIINDYNRELITFYETVRDEPETLIALLEGHKERLTRPDGGADYFYEVRGWDRNPALWGALSRAEKSARLMFLNKTCYNGLFRVNSAGEFNAPYGAYKNPDISPAGKIRAVSGFLNHKNVKIMCGDYRAATAGAGEGDFVYFDPPYDPVSDTASFTGYTKVGFTREDQQALLEECVRLDAEGVKFLLSNSATPFITGIYEGAGFTVRVVGASRAINSKGDRRGRVAEVLIRNYNKEPNRTQ